MVTRFSLALALVLSLSTGFAQSATKEEEPFVAIKYIGTDADKAQFQVDLINDGDQAYLFAIQETDGTVLYRERVTKNIFTKRFDWIKGDINTTAIKITVTGEKSKKTQVYEVNTTTRTVQELVINKL